LRVRIAYGAYEQLLHTLRTGFSTSVHGRALPSLRAQASGTKLIGRSLRDLFEARHRRAPVGPYDPVGVRRSGCCRRGARARLAAEASV
jgi:hypothetical protein